MSPAVPFQLNRMESPACAQLFTEANKTLDNSSILLYTVYSLSRTVYRSQYMNIIINSSSMVPIYEQIVESVKKSIASGELKPEEALPSVRGLARELKISALTVKKAYDQLEEEGFTVTVHGKGTFVLSINNELVREEQMKELESDMQVIVDKARRYDISMDELKDLFRLVAED